MTKKVAPKPCFLSNGAATVTCDLLESSNVKTTSLSGIGSRARAGVAGSVIRASGCLNAGFATGTNASSSPSETIGHRAITARIVRDHRMSKVPQKGRARFSRGGFRRWL